MRQLRALDPAPTIIAMSGGGLFRGQDLLHIATVLGAEHTLHKPAVPASCSRRCSVSSEVPSARPKRWTR